MWDEETTKKKQNNEPVILRSPSIDGRRENLKTKLKRFPLKTFGNDKK